MRFAFDVEVERLIEISSEIDPIEIEIHRGHPAGALCLAESYLRLTNKRLGLLINFNIPVPR
jgi:hypothetical protein